MSSFAMSPPTALPPPLTASNLGGPADNEVVEINLLLPARWALDLMELSRERGQSVGQILRSMIDQTQDTVTGDVRLKLYKGNVTVNGRKSPNSLYKERIATFEDDAGAYDQHDAEGFIKLQALRLRLRNME